MEALMGLFVTSAISALLGTVLKGVLRPISLLALGAVTLYLASGRATQALNALQDDPTNTATSPATVNSPAGGANTTLAGAPTPSVNAGWNTVASGIPGAVTNLPIADAGTNLAPGSPGAVPNNPAGGTGTQVPVPALW